jgi:2-polyprenyl-6-hydroxyphenyl methylase/3-demethylubiquinone-9 3-methyltransferase
MPLATRPRLIAIAVAGGMNARPRICYMRGRETISSGDWAVTATTINPEEVAKFGALADQWWDPTGKFRPLHRFNPVRLAYIREQVLKQFGRDGTRRHPFEGLKFLDVGCGGGLLCEPMARLGAEVTGVDAAEKNISVAKIHAAQTGLHIDYVATTAEALAASGQQFDVVLNMEVVEHVADVPLFLRSTSQLVAPGGLMFVATINRSAKAFALAIVGAEYVLNWLPRGTHSYDMLITPEELTSQLRQNGLKMRDKCGVSYSPLRDEWRKSRDMMVNYMVLAEREGVRSTGKEF